MYFRYNGDSRNLDFDANGQAVLENIDRVVGILYQCQNMRHDPVSHRHICTYNVTSQTSELDATQQAVFENMKKVAELFTIPLPQPEILPLLV